MRLLLVEDEPRLSDLASAALVNAGFVVDAVASAEDARLALRANPYDAGILDLGLPDADGLSVLAEARGRGDRTPILVLTARDAVDDRVKGLDLGADDYLVKPFALAELLARLRALLRRPGHALGVTLVAGLLSFDTVGREATVDSVALALPRQELAVLELLLRRQGRVVPKAVIEEKLYGLGDELGSNAVPVHVHHLRRKLGAAGAGCEIHTVRGVGYFIAEAATPAS